MTKNRADTSYDDAMTIGELMADLREMFPGHLLGTPRSRSEFDRPYVVLANGQLKHEGCEAYRTDIESAISGTKAWFLEQRQSHDVIVWRCLPEIGRENGYPVLYLRCHTMPHGMLKWSQETEEET